MQINNFLFTQSKNFRSRSTLFWLILSLGFSLFYSFLALQQAFRGDYVIQDDARQHIFWMLRFQDPGLFPNDLIADYFQSVAPTGYKFFYWVFNQIGIAPIALSKIVPSFLGLVLTGYSFALTLELLPLPLTGFVASLLLNQNLWLQDGLVSGTPKAFALPLFVAFLYYFLRRSLLGVCLTIIGLGLFYPTLVFICSGLLVISLFRLENWRISIVKSKANYIFAGIGLGVAFLVMLPYAIATSDFAPTITLAQARELPEFQSGGRSGFFTDNVWDFWFNGSRTSLRIPSALIPLLAYLGLLFSFATRKNKAQNLQNPSQLKIQPQIKLLSQLAIVSFVMFLVAHSLLFALHLPSRYTQNSIRIIIILLASIVLTFTWEHLLKRATQRSLIQKLIYRFLALLLAVVLIFYPHTQDRFVWTNYVTGSQANLYEFLQQQPKDSLIASLTAETDNLPTFAQRSILASREYAIPYHWGYYEPFRQRASDLITAQYSPDLDVVKSFIAKYGVTHFLIEDSSFTPDYLAKNKWIRQHEAATEGAIAALEQGKIFVINQAQESCSVFKQAGYNLLDSKCILRQTFQNKL